MDGQSLDTEEVLQLLAQTGLCSKFVTLSYGSMHLVMHIVYHAFTGRVTSPVGPVWLLKMAIFDQVAFNGRISTENLERAGLNDLPCHISFEILYIHQ